MDTQLFTLSKIFTERLFRIPDYQRGYAWTESQWKDFWNDIQQIEEGSNHYTGVLTLESVPKYSLKAWEDDLWIIDSKSFEPFYVVDGQQRLTTSIILIQSIVESVPNDTKLNYTDASEIKKKFIFDSKDGGISRSYIFGYDKDNPSYEFLKTKIFNEFSETAKSEETVYTNNLENAKKFFLEKISKLSTPEKELLFRKVTQSLLFNIFTISDDVDVCVAFETMNNRGKPLSYLELLKNRLIYLSIKIPAAEYDKSKLRSSINECWKSIYHSLGRNKGRPLDDDMFLGTHYVLYFTNIAEDTVDLDDNPNIIFERRVRKSDHYPRLLEDIFIQKRLMPDDKNDQLHLKDIYEYVKSLQIAVQSWYEIFNSPAISDDPGVGKWLDRLDRIGATELLPLILAIMLKVEKNSDKISILKAIERHIFVCRLAAMASYYFMRPQHFTKESVLLYHGKLDIKSIISLINESTNRILEHEGVLSDMREAFR